MKWNTEVNVKENKGFVNYEHSLLSLGSCFADEIGVRMKDGGFDISVNPFGVIFNPVSILQLVQNTLDGNLNESMILNRDMKWFHYAYHSRVFGSTQEELVKNIEGVQYSAQRRLLEGDRLMLTFGTAWAYRLIEHNRIVANCHKMPGQLFTKELIDLEKLKAFSEELFGRLFAENPKLKILVSVSPVRHSKDGLHENNLSKAVLHLFTKHLIDTFDQVEYFPAYELVIDELRDYRFYKEDLVHPSKQAVKYVFDKFVRSHFDDVALQKFSLYEKINKAQTHHFMNATIEEVKRHEDHIANLKKQLSELEK